MKKGFSTIELMVAMAIMIMVLTAVVVVSFGNQSFLIGAQTTGEAMNMAQELLEQEQAQARKDFNLVNNIASTTEDIYEKAVYVTLLPDLLTKEVKALIAWDGERGLRHMLELTTLIANFETPVGANTCNSNLSGDWQNPVIEETVSLPGTASDIDAYQNRLYITLSKTANNIDSTFLIFDITDPSDPDLEGSIDNEGAGGTTISGLNAVRVSQDPASSPIKTYAYAANAYAANYSSCDPIAKRNCGQLSIFDVTDPSAPVLGTNLMLASSSAPFVTGNWIGNSLFYKNGYLLLGLAGAGGSGPEFHVIDVHNPALMFGGTHILFPVGSYPVGNDVNAIAMRGTYAYIVTPNSQELQTLDMTNPSALTLAGGFNAATGAGNGKSLYQVGNYLYLGKTVPNSGADFHILDNTIPGAALIELGSGIDTGSSVNAVMQRDYLSFILTNSELQIFRTDDTDDDGIPNITMWAPTPLTIPENSVSPIPEPSMDCEDNHLYITSNDSSGNGFLYVIKAGI